MPVRGSFCCLRSYGYFTPVGQPYSGVVPYSRTGVHATFRLIHQLVQRSDFTVLIVSANISVLLMAVLSILSFDVDRILSHLWVIIILILAVLLLDSILLFLHQRRTQEQKRIHMIEQYVPIVEELISQVRARQHEFNNRMMAIEAAVASADTLEEARKEVAGLTGSIGISLNDRELLSCDSKMIAGMLFGKIKQAEVANLHIELSLHGLFKKTVTPETEWIEAIGIYWIMQSKLHRKKVQFFYPVRNRATSGIDSFQSSSAAVKY